MTPTWTSSLIDFLETLACRVRVMSLRQVRQLWSDGLGDGAGLDESLRRLVEAGLITGAVRPVAVAEVGAQPLFAWRPGSSAPDARAVASIAANRWPKTQSPIPLVSATRKACLLFGAAGGGLPPECHTGHDLILAEVYTRCRIRSPRIASAWVGEHATPMAERGVKNPDAYLADEAGAPRLVVESAGRYSARQVQAFHDHCASESLSYELW